LFIETPLILEPQQDVWLSYCHYPVMVAS